jgi:hypothetical protein
MLSIAIILATTRKYDNPIVQRAARTAEPLEVKCGLDNSADESQIAAWSKAYKRLFQLFPIVFGEVNYLSCIVPCARTPKPAQRHPVMSTHALSCQRQRLSGGLKLCLVARCEWVLERRRSIDQDLGIPVLRNRGLQGKEVVERYRPSKNCDNGGSHSNEGIGGLIPALAGYRCGFAGGTLTTAPGPTLSHIGSRPRALATLGDRGGQLPSHHEAVHQPVLKRPVAQQVPRRFTFRAPKPPATRNMTLLNSTVA